MQLQPVGGGANGVVRHGVAERLSALQSRVVYLFQPCCNPECLNFCKEMIFSAIKSRSVSRIGMGVSGALFCPIISNVVFMFMIADPGQKKLAELAINFGFSQGVIAWFLLWGSVNERTANSPFVNLIHTAVGAIGSTIWIFSLHVSPLSFVSINEIPNPDKISWYTTLLTQQTVASILIGAAGSTAVTVLMKVAGCLRDTARTAYVRYRNPEAAEVLT